MMMMAVGWVLTRARSGRKAQSWVSKKRRPSMWSSWLSSLDLLLTAEESRMKTSTLQKEPYSMSGNEASLNHPVHVLHASSIVLYSRGSGTLASNCSDVRPCYTCMFTSTF